MQYVLKVHPDDNVLVALQDLKAGEIISWSGQNVHITQDIPAKHKFVDRDLHVGDIIIMYGSGIGKAKEDIACGQAITTQNIVNYVQEVTYQEVSETWIAPDIVKWRDKTFMGYHRHGGSVGTANYWLVIPLVFCENRNIEVIREILEKELGYDRHYSKSKLKIQPLIDLYLGGAPVSEIENTILEQSGVNYQKNKVFPHVDGIKFLIHDAGCGGSRRDAEALCALLAGFIANPNVAGATVLSLGCQNAEVRTLELYLQNYGAENKPVYILGQQQFDSDTKFIEQAIKKTFIGLIEADKTYRRPAPLSKLVVGVECGGSDGFSGITANPSIGYASDLVVALGGKVLLSEFPELHGVEQELINRCGIKEVAEKFLNLMETYGRLALESGAGFETNPSPGNIKDGLITNAMKSAGAAKKGGTSPVKAVLDYTEQATKQGLNLLCTPGNDVESTTALAGSGVNMILFSTGLGTPTGNPVAPTIKISSNTVLFERMSDIIDIDTGSIITGTDTIEQKGEEILDYMIEVASGRAATRSMQLGQDDFIPWKRGISL